MQTPNNRPLWAIAYDIELAWPKVSPYARPYLEAMGSLTRISDNYYLDSGREIVLRFLCNATSFRGETARHLKAELKAIVGIK